MSFQNKWRKVWQQRRSQQIIPALLSSNKGIVHGEGKLMFITHTTTNICVITIISSAEQRHGRKGENLCLTRSVRYCLLLGSWPRPKGKKRRGHIYRAKYTAGIFVDVAIMSAISVILRDGKMLRWCYCGRERQRIIEDNLLHGDGVGREGERERERHGAWLWQSKIVLRQRTFMVFCSLKPDLLWWYWCRSETEYLPRGASAGGHYWMLF